MIKRTVVLTNRLGLHARAGAKVKNTIDRFDCRLFLEYKKQKAEASSLMSMLLLAAEVGSEITLYAEGPDAEQAVDALSSLFTDKFGEDY